VRRKIVCPICKKETHWQGNPFRPFCSARCRLIDLASWLGGDYAIPGEKTCSPLPEKDEKTGD